ncbi:MAG: DUF3809 domain-containing protein [Deinococcota bacterium]
MKITNTVTFDIHLMLDQARALDFVRDVRKSLAHASFLSDLHVSDVPNNPFEETLEQPHQSAQPVSDLSAMQQVEASIVVNAALFGERALSFQSFVRPTAKGARLEALPFSEPKLGWAEVSGTALVQPLPQGSNITYSFDITIHLDLPEAEKWGGKALSKMIHYTAQRTLERITNAFPSDIQSAADAFDLQYSQA